MLKNPALHDCHGYAFPGLSCPNVLQNNLMQHAVGMLGKDSPGNPSLALHEPSFAKLDSIIRTGLTTISACANFGIEDIMSAEALLTSA